MKNPIYKGQFYGNCPHSNRKENVFATYTVLRFLGSPEPQYKVHGILNCSYGKTCPGNGECISRLHKR